jgi:hypothetical protein
MFFLDLLVSLNVDAEEHMRKKLSLLFALFVSQKLYSLVDYTENIKAENKSIVQAKSQGDTGKSGLIWKSDISFETTYELMEINSRKVGLANFNTHFQTPFNFYFDLNYWHAKDGSQQNAGNPKVILGFNWFKFGNPNDEAQLNLYFGGRFKSNSNLGSSRNDKIFGVETTKKFGVFGLGVGYEYNMASTPSNLSDLAIGNFHHFEISGGWMATNDIQFEVTADVYRVLPSSDGSSVNKLSNELSFSTLSPKMNLQLFKSVSFELGARFQTKKAKSNSDLKTAKLLDTKGIYSNSVFSGLNFSI